MREQQVLEDREDVFTVFGEVKWTHCDDGGELPVDLPTRVNLFVQVNEDNTVYDIMDEDWG